MAAAACTILLAASCAHAPASAPVRGVRVLCRGEAERCFLVGSFNGWARAQVAMAREAGGTFALTLPENREPLVVACERHQAGGRIDFEAPLNADRLVADDFGGSNGLFEAKPGTPAPAQ